MKQPNGTCDAQRARTGVPGLDDILNGGLICHRLYLLDGDPGAGKTTLSLQYLFEGVKAGEKCLYVTLSETKEELCVSARMQRTWTGSSACGCGGGHPGKRIWQSLQAQQRL